MHILEKEVSQGPSESPSLSPEELVYAKEHADSLDNHFNTLLLRHMPSNLRKMDKKKAGKGSLCGKERVIYWHMHEKKAGKGVIMWKGKGY